MIANFLARRIAFNQQKSFSRFIIRLSVVATIISVAIMIITLAFANGFREKVSEKVFSFWGHIRIQERQPDKSILSEETLIQKNDAAAAAIKENNAVKSIHPYATKYALLKTRDEMEGVLLKGFDSTYDYNNISNFLKQGRRIAYNDSTYSREIIISEYTARRLHLKLNDRIFIYFIQPNTDPWQASQPRIRPDRLTIVGIYKTGIEDYDKRFAIGDLKLIQRLNDWKPDEIGGYEIFLHNYKDIDAAATEIFKLPALPIAWDTKSVKQIVPNIFDWLNVQDMTRNVLLAILIVVALINLITCLIILVLERMKMIGILKALGATNWAIQKIFLHHSFYIAGVGIFFGLLLALCVIFLQQKTGFIKLKEQAYYLSEAAVSIRWWEIGLVCLGTLSVCLLILTIPSLLVRKIQPAKAIRFN